MKKIRIISAILLAMLSVLLLAPVVWAYTYSAPITVAETSGNDYTMLPIRFASNNDWMAANGFTDSDARDVRVETLAGAQRPRMVADDKTLSACAVPPNSNTSLLYTTGNTPADFAIVVGHNGYVTIADSSFLEFGNSGKIEQKGYVDTTTHYGSSAKSPSSTYSSSSDGVIDTTYTAYNTTWVATSGTKDDTSTSFNMGQRFATPNYTIYRGFLFFDTSPIPDGATILSATLKLWVNSDETSGADFLITIQNGMPTYPTDPLAVTDYNKAYYSGDGGSLTTAGISIAAYSDISLNSTGLGWINKAGTTKFAVRSSREIAGTTPTGEERVVIRASEYAGTGSDPYLIVTYLGADLVLKSGAFSTYVNASQSIRSAILDASNNEVKTATVTGLSGGEYIVKTSADGNDMTLSVTNYTGTHQGNSPQTALAIGAGAPNNPNDWKLNRGNVAPYMVYYKQYDVDWTLRAQYQPNTIIKGVEYTTGTATFANGSAAVLGNGTSWTSSMVGSLIRLNADSTSPNNVWHIVSSVTDTTHLALTANYSPNAGGSGAYTMAPRLPDRDVATVEDGVITWSTPANPTGVTVTLGGMVPSTVTTTTSPEDLPQDIAPTTGIDMTASASGATILATNPLHPLIAALASLSSSGTPAKAFTELQIWRFFALGLVLMAMLALLVAVPGHQFLSGVAGIVGCGLAVHYTIFPFWTLVLFGLYLVATLIWERQPSI